MSDEEWRRRLEHRVEKVEQARLEDRSGSTDKHSATQVKLEVLRLGQEQTQREVQETKADVAELKAQQTATAITQSAERSDYHAATVAMLKPVIEQLGEVRDYVVERKAIEAERARRAEEDEKAAAEAERLAAKAKAEAKEKRDALMKRFGLLGKFVAWLFTAGLLAKLGHAIGKWWAGP